MFPEHRMSARGNTDGGTPRRSFRAGTRPVVASRLIARRVRGDYFFAADCA